MLFGYQADDAVTTPDRRGRQTRGMTTRATSLAPTPKARKFLTSTAFRCGGGASRSKRRQKDLPDVGN